MTSFAHPTAGGWIVRSVLNQNGAGKLVSLNGRTAVVEYFHSVGLQTRIDVPKSSLVRVWIQPQTRCYLKGEEDGRWRMGRVRARFDSLYQVDFPDQQTVHVSESCLYVRCAEPADPTDTLVAHGHETVFFHTARARFVRSILKQRSAFRGLTALASSGIELLPHQVEVVRRVLDDPVQRYLLADEVGLGKTIEAGLILRQLLLDAPAASAVVIAPPALIRQWEQELAVRFGISDSRVTVCAVEDLARTPADEPPALVVVDEAHHLGALAYSSSRADREAFGILAAFAHGSPRLLLLSATPAPNHEREFLAMLHLLDPATYSLDGLDEFRRRVEQRQPIGRLLLAFTEDADPFALTMDLEKLRALFGDDSLLTVLINDLAAVLSQNAPDAERIELVRRIRTHVSETYRLHRRMLRSRRADLEGVFLAARSDAETSTPHVLSEPDERVRDVHDLIDEWRAYSATAFQAGDVTGGVEMGAELTAATPEEDSAVDFLLLMLDCAATSPSLLEELVRARRVRTPTPRLLNEVGAAVIRALEAPTFVGETAILNRLLAIVPHMEEHRDRTDALADYLRELRDRAGMRPPPRCVVYTPQSSAASELVRRLEKRFGARAVAACVGPDSAKAVERFRTDRDCFVLVGDHTVEEGLNLQFADHLILLSVLWAPTRLEQLIGRVDRIGRTRPVRTTVFVGLPRYESSLYAAWFELLRDGFGIFRRSIASLQFFTDRKLSLLRRALLVDGAAGVREAIPTMRDEIADEHQRIAEQNALDEIDASADHASRYFQSMDDFDAEVDRFEEDVEAWLCKALRFGRNPSRSLPHVVRYESTPHTLVPADVLRQHFAPHLGGKVTYSRRVAVMNPGVRVLRVGHELLSALWTYVQWDDRGQAFAVWRHEPEWSAASGDEGIGFRVQYIVEADTGPARQALAALGLPAGAEHALQRRADALFPPSLETLYFDIDGNEVADETLLRYLRRPVKRRQEGGVDTNLTKHRLRYLESLVDPDRWDWVCRTVRVRSEAALRDRDDLRRRSRAASEELQRRTAIVTAQLRARSSAQSGFFERDRAETLREESLQASVGAALTVGVECPLLRVNSIGCVVVSGRELGAADALDE